MIDTTYGDVHSAVHRWISSLLVDAGYPEHVDRVTDTLTDLLIKRTKTLGIAHGAALGRAPGTTQLCWDITTEALAEVGLQ